eukprot:170499_1
MKSQFDTEDVPTMYQHIEPVNSWCGFKTYWNDMLTSIDYMDLIANNRACTTGDCKSKCSCCKYEMDLNHIFILMLEYLVTAHLDWSFQRTYLSIDLSNPCKETPVLQNES